MRVREGGLVCRVIPVATASGCLGRSTAVGRWAMRHAPGWAAGSQPYSMPRALGAVRSQGCRALLQEDGIVARRPPAPTGRNSGQPPSPESAKMAVADARRGRGHARPMVRRTPARQVIRQRSDDVIATRPSQWLPGIPAQPLLFAMAFVYMTVAKAMNWPFQAQQPGAHANLHHMQSSKDIKNANLEIQVRVDSICIFTAFHADLSCTALHIVQMMLKYHINAELQSSTSLPDASCRIRRAAAHSQYTIEARMSSLNGIAVWYHKYSNRRLSPPVIRAAQPKMPDAKTGRHSPARSTPPFPSTYAFAGFRRPFHASCIQVSGIRNRGVRNMPSSTLIQMSAR